MCKAATAAAGVEIDFLMIDPFKTKLEFLRLASSRDICESLVFPLLENVPRSAKKDSSKNFFFVCVRKKKKICSSQMTHLVC